MSEPAQQPQQPILRPPQAKGRTSVVRVADDWYVVSLSRELRRKPLAVVLLGTPLVVFRGDDGQPRALLDRCSHRNVPLSLGRVVGCHVECGYHGWQFDGQGECQALPGLCGEAKAKARRVPSFAARELDGFVWVYATPDVEPVREPYRFPCVNERGYTTVQEEVQSAGTLHWVAENALDVPHTAFLHGGLFRTPERRVEIEVQVRRWPDRVEAEYIGEPRPPGLAGKLLAPGGGVVKHFDRFLLPCVAQVEYRLGDHNHFLVTTAITPVEDYHCRLFASISFRLKWIPGWLVALFLRPVAVRIFGQDAKILAKQTDWVHRFGGEEFVNTEVDVLGPHILALLKAAERGDRGEAKDDAEPVTRSLPMVV
jgi:phenylpropionate dioxygenase-like ring-hydroxylating dioxygenase large terminal subunit